MYRVEAIDLFLFYYYDFCEYVEFGGDFVKIWYFVNNCWIEVRILKFVWTYVTHIIVIYIFCILCFAILIVLVSLIVKLL